MKKIALILAAASLACGCTEETPNAPPPGGGRTFTATIKQSADPAATKAAADCGFELLPWSDEPPKTRLHMGTVSASGAQMLWSAGDTIATCYGTRKMVFPPSSGSFSGKVSHPLVGGAGETTATFSGSLPNAAGYIAWFPDNHFTTYDEDLDVISHTIPNPQKQSASGNADHIGPHCFMVNTPNYTATLPSPLTLSHCFTLLQIDITNQIADSTIRADRLLVIMDDNIVGSIGFWRTVEIVPSYGSSPEQRMNTADPYSTRQMNLNFQNGGMVLASGETYTAYMLVRLNATEAGKKVSFVTVYDGRSFPGGSRYVPVGGFLPGHRYRVTLMIPLHPIR